MGDSPTVKVADVTLQINKFLDNIYPGDVHGFLYSPTLDRKTNEWRTNYFAWPTERELFIKHVLKHTGKKEVYIGPALYKSDKHTAVKSNILGSIVLWVEFDGIDPQYNDDVPVPHFMLPSSNLENHMHVYWKLDKFCEDPEKLENINHALTYSLGADYSGWDITQVLRLPLTINHKREQFTGTFKLNESQPDPYTLETFVNLKIPTIEGKLEDIDFDNVPNVSNILLEKIIGKNAAKLYEKESLPVGERSTGLMALGYYLAEHRRPRLTDTEIFAFLKEADDRWGKFKDRRDRDKRLWDIVVKVRQKYPWIGADLDNKLIGHLSALSVIEGIEPVDWIVEGVLEDSGILFLAGPPGCGKTQVSLNFAMHMACSKPFLGWNFGEPKKQLFVSMEMGRPALAHFLRTMYTQFSDKELELIDENLQFNFNGNNVLLDTDKSQDLVEGWMDENYKVIYFDSLGQATTEEITRESTIKSTFNFVNRAKAEYETAFWFIHHTRKAQAENKRPNKLSDIYGSQYIAAHASAVVGLYPLGGEIEVSALKIRMEKEFDTFRIQRNPDTLGFHISGVKGLTESATAEVEKEYTNDDTDGQSFPSTKFD